MVKIHIFILVNLAQLKELHTDPYERGPKYFIGLKNPHKKNPTGPKYPQKSYE